MRGLLKINLIFVFTIVFWHAGWPFMGELFAYRSKDMVFQWVMGSPELGKRLQLEDRMMRNKERFEALQDETKTQIIAAHQQMQEKLNEPWYLKLSKSFHILLFELPPLERTWIVLSFAISFMGFMGIEGVFQAVWLMPLVSIFFIWNNQIHGLTESLPADQQLFPTEEWIQEKYIGHKLSDNISDQQVELTKGLQIYFITEWAQEIPSKIESIFLSQLEKGEYFFHQARVDKMIHDVADDSNIFHQKRSLVGLFFFFVWNLFFAWKLYGTRIHLKANPGLQPL